MVRNVSIYNRVDKFGERLQNFYVLFSTVPFLSDQLQDLLADPLVYKTHFMYMEEEAHLYIDQVAQYIRIQLAGTNYLSLAEVEVWGHPPVEDWQHTEGMKRWTPMYAEGDYPYGRSGHTLTMYRCAFFYACRESLSGTFPATASPLLSVLFRGVQQ